MAQVAARAAQGDWSAPAYPAGLSTFPNLEDIPISIEHGNYQQLYYLTS
jgi:hypothetical protein